jgi:hypothetical protein
MEPNIWGPSLWQVLHGVAHVCPPSHAHDFWLMVDLLPNILPCSLCRQSVAAFYSSNAALREARNGNHPALWAWTLHNLANEKLHHRVKSADHVARRLQTRQLLGLPLFELEALWHFLALGAVCADMVPDGAKRVPRQHDFVRFMRHLGATLQGTHQFPAAARALVSVTSAPLLRGDTLSCAAIVARVAGIPLTSLWQAGRVAMAMPTTS